MSFYGFEQVEVIAKLISMGQVNPEQTYFVLDILATILIISIAFALYRIIKGFKNRNKNKNIQEKIQAAPQSQQQIPVQEYAKQTQQHAQLQHDLQTGFQPRRIGKWQTNKPLLVKTAQDSTDEQFQQGMNVLPIGDDMQVKEKLPPINFELQPLQYYWKQKEPTLWLVIGICSILIFLFIK